MTLSLSPPPFPRSYASNTDLDIKLNTFSIFRLFSKCVWLIFQRNSSTKFQVAYCLSSMLSKWYVCVFFISNAHSPIHFNVYCMPWNVTDRSNTSNFKMAEILQCTCQFAPQNNIDFEWNHGWVHHLEWHFCGLFVSCVHVKEVVVMVLLGSWTLPRQ